MKDTFAIGEKLRKLRDFHHYTQEYVASQIGVAQNTYSQYESGSLSIDREKLEKVASLYKVDVNLFFSPEPLTFNLHGDHGTQVAKVGNDLVQNQPHAGQELTHKMWSHIEERSKCLEELFAKTLEVFDRMAKRE